MRARLNRNFLFTLDYELYLGAKSGTVRKCLLDPTDAVTKILDEYDCKAVIFVDVLGLQKMERISFFREDLEKVRKQLKSLYDNGHFVFPHLHPHWKDALYSSEDCQFSFPSTKKYSLAALELEEVDQLFSLSLDFLKNFGVEYDKWGYRAGGWCMQPFSRYSTLFKKYSLAYDFSVLPGYFNTHKDFEFDYRSVDFKVPYRFDAMIDQESKSGSFFEFPISTTKFRNHEFFFDKLIRKWLWYSGDRGWGDGKSAQNQGTLNSINKEEMVSLDVLTRAKIGGYYRYLLDQSFMHWISHPKMISRHSLRCLNVFLNKVHKKYEIESNFKKMIN